MGIDPPSDVDVSGVRIRSVRCIPDIREDSELIFLCRYGITWLVFLYPLDQAIFGVRHCKFSCH